MYKGVKYLALAGLICFVFLVAGQSVSGALPNEIVVVGQNIVIQNSGNVNLTEVYADAEVDDTMLWYEGSGVWGANYSLTIDWNATLRLNPDDNCSWLKLNNTGYEEGANRSYIEVEGTLFVNDTMITSWNYTTQENNTDYTTFRPYIFIHTKYGRALFRNSTIGYLGYNKRDMRGITYLDDNSDEDYPGGQATGYVYNCTIMENYIGVTFGGCINMNVTYSDINHSWSAGLVYTGNPEYSTSEGQSDNGSIFMVNIWNTSDGIRLWGCNYTRADNVDGYNCTDGVTSYLTTNMTITNSEFYSNSGTGIWMNATTLAYITAGTKCYNNVGSGTYLINSSFNKLSAHHNYNNTHDFQLDPDSHDNNFTSCHPHDSTYGFYLNQSHNNSFTLCRPANETFAWKILGGDFNNLTACGAYDCNYSILITDQDVSLSNNNTIIDFLSYNAVVAHFFMDEASHNNTFINCTATDPGVNIDNDYGFVIDNARDNNFSYCTVSNVEDAYYLEDSAQNRQTRGNVFFYCNASEADGYAGMTMRDYANNNTARNCYMNADFGWGILIGPGIGGAGPGDCPENNSFYECVVNNCTVAVLTYNNDSNNDFISCEFRDNYYGVDVEDNASSDFTNCISYGNTQYDFKLERGTEVNIYGDYILQGIENTVMGSTSPYNTISHALGDSTWTLYTKELSIKANDDNTVYINVTQWNSLVKAWRGTATGDTIVYAKISGWTAGKRYNCYLNNAVHKRYTSNSGRMLGPTAGIVHYNYSGGWSSYIFKVQLYSAPSSGSGGSSGSSGDSTTTTTTTPGSDVSEGMDWTLLLIGMVAVIAVVAVAVFWYQKNR